MSKDKKENEISQENLLNRQYQRMKELKEVALDKYTPEFLLKNVILPNLRTFQSNYDKFES